MTMFDLVGVLGTLLMLSAFALPQMGKLRQDSLGYLLMNAFGAGFVLISLSEKFNLAAFLLEAAWLVVSVYGMARWAMARRG
ncbi:MAG: hypothetical protein HQ481_04555 [Alphaproteobacteria bacterium]|nr:hypothetical protein [Alphaproteobacteria bacterium]